MMSMDRDALQEFLDQIADRYYGYEIVEILEDAGLITVQEVIAALEDFIIEGKDLLEAR